MWWGEEGQAAFRVHWVQDWCQLAAGATKLPPHSEFSRFSSSSFTSHQGQVGLAALSVQDQPPLPGGRWALGARGTGASPGRPCGRVPLRAVLRARLSLRLVSSTAQL